LETTAIEYFLSPTITEGNRNQMLLLPFVIVRFSFNTAYQMQSPTHKGLLVLFGILCKVSFTYLHAAALHRSYFGNAFVMYQS
jgi:hypothetical protein